MARCRSCSAPLPPHSNLCKYCGAKSDVDLQGVHEYTIATPESERFCPRCDIALATINIKTEGQFRIERCGACFGLFFDPGELEALLASSVSNVFRIDYQGLQSFTEEQGRRDQPVAYGKCPVCRKFMNRVNFAHRSGVVVDRCRDHGVWLDGGELRQLLEWKKAGGQLLHEKVRAERLEEEERKERAKAAAQSALALPPDAGDAWSDRDVCFAGDGGLPSLLARLVERLFV